MRQTFMQTVTKYLTESGAGMYFRCSGREFWGFSFIIATNNNILKRGNTLRRFLSLKLGKCKWSPLTHSLLTSG